MQLLTRLVNKTYLLIFGGKSSQTPPTPTPDIHIDNPTLIEAFILALENLENYDLVLLSVVGFKHAAPKGVWGVTLR